MDPDIRQKTEEIGLHIQDIGKQVASPRACLESIYIMQDSLTRVTEMLDTIVDIQNVRKVIQIRTAAA